MMREGREDQYPVMAGIEVLSDDVVWTEDGSVSTNSENEIDSSPEATKNLIQAAKHYVQPGRAFRVVSYLYAERKLALFFLIHFAATLIVWGHFATIKWNEQVTAVPTTAPSYLWKRVTPTMEFGAMHAILFTMALIPLTMCRLSISVLSETLLNHYIPFNRTLRMHIHLGYTMVLTLCFATVIFFTFFGKMCANGEQKFCNLLTSEIMSTGYGILAAVVIVGVTSYYRHRIPYELFYIVHHLVFIMYAITIAHTLDSVHRSGARDRSQAFKWFSSTLLLYICDRATMHINHKYEASITSISAVTGSDGSRLILLKVRRPALFSFKPGQYCFLRVKSIDIHWHPFSIASGPESLDLEFYIDVLKKKSWTGKLWNLLNDDSSDSEQNTIKSFVERVEIMGPYGTALTNAEYFSHGLAIGTGTGIVPIMSLLKQHVRSLAQRSPEHHFADLAARQSHIQAMEFASSSRKASVVKRLLRMCTSRDVAAGRGHVTRGEKVRSSIASTLAEHTSHKRMSSRSKRDLKTAALFATRSIYGTLFMSFLPVLGMSLIGLSISWTTINVDLFGGMVESLQIGTIVLQACFAFVSLFLWNSDSILSFVDAALCIVAPFADWFWFLELGHGRLRSSYLTNYCLLTGYMTLRMWTVAVRPRPGPVQEAKSAPFERLEVVWVTRSATLVSEIYPEVRDVWNELVKAFGKQHAAEVCQISIYVTDRNSQDILALQNEIGGSDLYQRGCVQFERPDFSQVIEDHTIDLICSRSHSRSLLAFCGSPQLSRIVHECKISNDMITTTIGHKNHQMEFVSESYGGSKSRSSTTDEDFVPRKSSMLRSLSTRRVKRLRASAEF